MLIVCILLIILALGYGYTHCNYISWGFDIKNFKTPYYLFGLNFEPLKYYDSKGDTYNVSSLKIGFVAITIWFNFYTYMGKHDFTVESTPATI